MRPTAGLAVLLFLAAACSSGGSDDSSTFSAQAAAKELAGMTFRTSGHAARGAGQGPVSGRFAPSGAAAMSFPVFLPDGTQPAQVLRTAKQSWLRRVVSATPATGVESVLTVAPGTLRWTPVASAGVALLAAGYDPVALLNAVAAAGKQFHPVGDTGRTYRATMPGPFGSGEQQVEIVVDGDAVPQRVKVDNATSTIEYRISPTAPFTISAPPAGEIADPASVSTGPKPAGSYETVDVAATGGVELTVLRAPGTEGSLCWKGESPQSYRPAAKNAPDGALCIAALVEGFTVDDQVKFPIDTSAASDFEAIGISVPEGAIVKLGFLDGTSQVLERHGSGLALYVGPVLPIPAWVEVTIGTVVVNCGAGPVTTPEDAAGADVDAVRDGIWACVPIPDGS